MMRTDQILQAMNAAQVSITTADGCTPQALSEVLQRLIETLAGFEQHGAEPWVIDGLSVLTLEAGWLINQWARHEYGLVDPRQRLLRSFFGVPVDENGTIKPEDIEAIPSVAQSFLSGRDLRSGEVTVEEWQRFAMRLMTLGRT